MFTEPTRLRDSVFPALNRVRNQLRVGAPATLAALLEGMGPQGPMVLIMILCLPLLFPISLGPIGTAISFVVFVLALMLIRPSMQKILAGRWLQISLTQKVVGGMRRVAAILSRYRRTEGYLPNYKYLAPRIREKLLLGFIMGNAILMAMPLPLVPLANVLPALCILLFCLALMRHNDFMTTMGFLFTILTLIWFGLLAYFGVKGVTMAIGYVLGFGTAASH
jgi:hypothetical protein